MIVEIFLAFFEREDFYCFHLFLFNAGRQPPGENFPAPWKKNSTQQNNMASAGVICSNVSRVYFYFFGNKLRRSRIPLPPGHRDKATFNEILLSGINMKSIIKILTVLLLCACLFLSCKNDTSNNRTYEYFAAHINKNMSDQVVIKTFGQPDDDVGSGIHIFIYKLADGTTIDIGVTDFIYYSSHRDANGQILHILI